MSCVSLMMKTSVKSVKDFLCNTDIYTEVFMLLYSGAMLQITKLIRFISKCDCPVNVMDYVNLSDMSYAITHSFLEFFSCKHKERQ